MRGCNPWSRHSKFTFLIFTRHPYRGPGQTTPRTFPFVCLVKSPSLYLPSPPRSLSLSLSLSLSVVERHDKRAMGLRPTWAKRERARKLGWGMAGRMGGVPAGKGARKTIDRCLWRLQTLISGAVEIGQSVTPQLPCASQAPDRSKAIWRTLLVQQARLGKTMVVEPLLTVLTTGPAPSCQFFACQLWEQGLIGWALYSGRVSDEQSMEPRFRTSQDSLAPAPIALVQKANVTEQLASEETVGRS